jgi:hypothetical protein
MEHNATSQELQILSGIDFIVPLKQIGLITRAVLESLELFYHPRRIIVITCKKEADILTSLVKHWNVGIIEVIYEEVFFQQKSGLSIEDIIQEYDMQREGEQREPGWWIQQLIKLGAATEIEGISNVYIVWDGDLVPIRRWKLCDYADNGDIQFYIAILQAESRSEFNSYQYAACMKSLTDMSPCEPEEGGTFVSHHMAFNKNRVIEMINLMIETTGYQNIPWPKLIMSHSRKFFRFSEYKTYATFMINNYSQEFHYHKLCHFGQGGIRFRDTKEIMAKILLECPLDNGGISYDKLKMFFENKYSPTIPGYIQLEHVYGM